MSRPLSVVQTPAEVIVTAAGDVHGADTPEARELARRIKACVNACEGLSTEELENGIVLDMCRVLTMAAPLLKEACERKPSAA